MKVKLFVLYANTIKMPRILNSNELEIVKILKEKAIQESRHNTNILNFNEKKEEIDFYSKTFATILVNKIKNEFGVSIFIELKESEQDYYEFLFNDAYNELINIDRLQII